MIKDYKDIMQNLIQIILKESLTILLNLLEVISKKCHKEL